MKKFINYIIKSKYSTFEMTIIMGTLYCYGSGTISFVKTILILLGAIVVNSVLEYFFSTEE